MKTSFLANETIYLEGLFEEYRNNPALVTPSGIRTFGEIRERLRAVIFHLKEAGVRQNDSVALHAENGEFGHNQHILTYDIVAAAVEAAADPAQYPESAARYGAWDTPKLYVHLYEDNRLAIDFDTPEAYFDGLSSYDVARLAFEKNLSQVDQGAAYNMVGERSDAVRYDNRAFGLARSTVGGDVRHDSFFENLP